MYTGLRKASNKVYIGHTALRSLYSSVDRSKIMLLVLLKCLICNWIEVWLWVVKQQFYSLTYFYKTIVFEKTAYSQRQSVNDMYFANKIF